MMLVVMCVGLLETNSMIVTHAEETIAQSNIFDLANCSVSPKNAQPGDVVTWKLKLTESFEVTSGNLRLVAPNGNTFYAYLGDIETDVEGNSVITYTVPDVGNNGIYQIFDVELFNDITGEAVWVVGEEVSYHDWQDMSSLSFEISGQIEDKTAPIVDQENGQVYIEDEWICFDFPVVEAGSGISSKWVTIVRYDESSSTWEYYVREGYSDPYDVCSFSIDEFENGVTYGLKSMEVTDVAGNTGKCDFFEEDIEGIDYIPEEYRFTVENSQNSQNSESNITISDLADVLLIDECSVSPKNATAGDVVTWNIKLKEGYTLHSLNLKYPNDYITHLNNFKTEEDGTYSYSFTVPTAGYNGTYKILEINIQSEEDVKSGSVHSISSLDDTYVDHYVMDLSSMYVNVEGLPEDTEPLKIDTSKIDISVQDDIIRICVPIDEDLSGIEHVSFTWCWYDEGSNIWKIGEFGTSFGLDDLTKTDEGYVGEESVSNILRLLYAFYGIEGIDTFGIGSVNGVDIAGNLSRQEIIPHVLDENYSWGKVEERTGLDAIPEHLRVLLCRDTSVLPNDDLTEEQELQKSNCSAGHTYKEWTEVTAPTCAKEGLRERICSVCGTKETEVVAVTTTHSYGEWEVTKEAQCDKAGTQIKTCTSCGAMVEEAIPATGFVKGGEFEKGNVSYEIKTKKGKKGTVVYQGSTKKSKKVKVPKTVKIDGTTYTVTEIADDAFKGNTKITSVTIPEGVTKIGKNAFNGCKNLKTIIIKSTKLKTVGKNAIKGINKEATIKVPKEQLKEYKKLFKSKTGYKKSMKIKK